MLTVEGKERKIATDEEVDRGVNPRIAFIHWWVLFIILIIFIKWFILSVFVSSWHQVILYLLTANWYWKKTLCRYAPVVLPYIKVTLKYRSILPLYSSHVLMTVKDKTWVHAKHAGDTGLYISLEQVWLITSWMHCSYVKRMRMCFYQRVWVGEEHRRSGTLTYQGGWPGCLHTEASQICKEVVSPTSRWNIPGYQQPPHLQQTPWAAKWKKSHLYGTDPHTENRHS